MFTITFPDSSVKQYENPIAVSDIAVQLSKSLAKEAIIASVDGRLVDLSFIVDCDSAVQIFTKKDPEGLEAIRHSCAHLMAQAVQSLFPGAQVVIGPVIDNGFYYDFHYERSFTMDDFAAIEKKMKEISQQKLTITRHEYSRAQAIEMFQSIDEDYKVKIIQDIPETDVLSVYHQGDFFDLCRGPHVPHTGFLKYFKLMRVSGAYWRGNAQNEMLSRIYATAWESQQALDDYLLLLKEAEKRDHRLLGRTLDLFHQQEESPGMVFWHPRGWTLWLQIELYIRGLLDQHGYKEVKTPMLMSQSLWQDSGHWEHYHGNMFITESEKRTYAVKPMNCPGHVQIFNHDLRSYRDLPLRLSEFGSCHRNEPSGALHGLMRVRGFVQDDAHIFCAPEQILDEVHAFCDLLKRVYSDFGFNDVGVQLSLRPEKRIGSDESWDLAEQALREALAKASLTWTECPGEGAFYGPKIEFHIRDALNRSWQCGTLQLDFALPERLGAQYVASDNSKQMPVMLHRAILGSIERFIGILIEHYSGHFPLWLSPVQVVIASITEKQVDYAKDVYDLLIKNGIRAVLDLRNEKIGYKIREHALQKIPYVVVIGDEECQTQTVAARYRSQDIGVMSLSAFQERLEVESRERMISYKAHSMRK